MNRTIQALAVIALSVLPATTASAGGMHCDAPQTEGVTTLVDISKGCFAPTVARVSPGATVRFTNSDPTPHNLVGHAITWGQIEPLPPGQAMEVTFDEAGMHPFACTLHPGMVGVIVVEDGSAEPAALFDDPSGRDESAVSTPSPSGAPAWFGRGLGWVGAGAALLAVGWRRVRGRARTDQGEPAVG
jgi:plastocyanin